MAKIEANIPTDIAVIKGQKLPIMESFYTLQGEGKFAGHAAYFIRLAGCDVGCVWCDVKESWDASTYPLVDVEILVKQAKSFAAKIIVVTGGEPLMYDLTLLTKQLKEAGFRTHIETSGAYPLTGTWDWITFSPKKFKQPLANFFEDANEFKVIVFNNSDITWANEMAKHCALSVDLYLQPEWDKKEKLLPMIIEVVKENPIWKLSLQTHKYLNIP
jgi:organic radical activating enzyme